MTAQVTSAIAELIQFVKDHPSSSNKHLTPTEETELARLDSVAFQRCQGAGLSIPPILIANPVFSLTLPGLQPGFPGLNALSAETHSFPLVQPYGNMKVPCIRVGGKVIIVADPAWINTINGLKERGSKGRIMSDTLNPNPYFGLADAIHRLVWLVRDAHVANRSLPTNRCSRAYLQEFDTMAIPCRDYVRTARRNSHPRGIPFSAFDAALNETESVLYEFGQVVLRNPDYPFSYLDQRYVDVEKRLRDLGATYEPEAIGGDHKQEPKGTTPATNAATGDETPSSDLTTEERKQRIAQMEPAARKAYLAYQYAERKKGKRLEDREAHDLLTEEGIPDDADDRGELTDYKLPVFDTWSRQLRTARKALGEQKYTSTRGRSHGSSIVRPGEI